MIDSNANLNLNLLLKQFNPSRQKKIFARPIIIVSAPRSGSTLLFETLINSSHLWSIRNESHHIFSRFPSLTFENDAKDSASLDESHYSTELGNLFRSAFLSELQNSDGIKYTELSNKIRPNRVSFIEKTPRNALNIPFLLKVFPDAKFIFLHRKPEENINSMMEGWERKGSFVRFTDLPDWPLGYWCFVLPKDWRKLKGRSIAEIAAFQWKACNEKIMTDLANLSQSRVLKISYDELVGSTSSTFKKLCTFGEIKVDRALYDVVTNPLPLSSTTASKPKKDKWKQREDEISAVMPLVQETVEKIKVF